MKSYCSPSITPLLAGLFAIHFLFGCATTTKEEIPPPTPPVQTPDGFQVDVNGLSKFLGMDISKNSLGYFERRFNTCEVGFGYPKSRDCQNLYFVVINYQLLCRQSQGTVSETIDSSSLPAVRNKTGRWSIQNRMGTAQTDTEGRGQIKGIFARPQRNERLKLTIQNDFLYARAGELKQALTPTEWCY